MPEMQLDSFTLTITKALTGLNFLLIFSLNPKYSRYPEVPPLGRLPLVPTVNS